ncbi:nicotinate-nucleotide adenylyltransferase [Capnocytophaga haemolytica]|jgi:nicotinate-nucleotide adenylyltransferase|uniref:Probable nicotinate-nucleotide adenylyltransferase n=1 Tax=Capnocytophaga haemolytica TaxID=45243 RepID=A0AAX2H2S0_9FLAO|nr:nicotinate (nicotinamide) nucleotide adenylyltransferase [Capnocytophaga haemolytica]AMD85630.1 nicotinic acid mononucleotide adenylyltransferase [Capnocytophaga haemolytica]SFN89273.1 nicotinate-nucleotide adenylyltransferase [Capnocytophaga haemolytica]SNV16693.1 Probable nicotinate-nucleotide adenylyltransferase [Capnocytophaga haemolytica]
MKKHIGLYFGSFNPIHIGHLIIANHLVEHSDIEELWMVVTPQNPLKEKPSLLNNYQRLEMVHLALEPYDKLRPSDIEFHLPQPNYTVQTLLYLEEKYPEATFSLIMGEDNLKTLHKWKNYEYILENYTIYVYPRISEGVIPEKFADHPHITRVMAPIIELSATFIRNEIRERRNVQPLLPEKVWDYIDRASLYK